MAESDSAGAVTGRRFGVGAVLSQTASLFGRRFGLFLLLGLVTLSPLLVVTLVLLPAPGAPPNPAAVLRVSAVTVPLTLILNVICQATILFGAVQVMRGLPFGFGQSMGVALRRFVPVVIVGIVVSVLSVLATVLLIVPGIIVFCMLYVAVPVCVVERGGIFECLGRSSQLTKGHRWAIFGILVLVAIVNSVGNGILNILGSRLGLGADVHLIVAIVQFVWQAAVTSFSGVLAAVIYHDLRVDKEGVDTEKIAAVFA
jgi:uncharacterized membrane protein